MLNERHSRSLWYIIRLPLLAVAVISLFAGILAGLWRAGLQFSLPVSVSLALHGPLMIGAFLGTLICLERAVAVNRPWAYLAPGFSALSALFLLLAPSSSRAALLSTLASFALLAIMGNFYRRDRQLHFLILAVAPLFWLAGNLFWLVGNGFPEIVLWWAAFLVLTIAGERLELSRVLAMTTAKRNLFLLSSGTIVIGVLVSVLSAGAGWRIFGAGNVWLALWLVRYDMVRINLRRSGQLRFVSLALISGYLWLAVSGILCLYFGEMQAGPVYDALLHSLFLGFLFSMIFGHAPIVFPAILKTRMNFSPLFYGHLVFLHASLVVRLWGDLAFSPAIRIWGSTLNGLAILIFFAVTISTVIRSRSNQPPKSTNT